MKNRKIIPIRNFPHKLFIFVAIFVFIAFLFTLKPVAEFVKTVVEKIGISFPPVEIFQNVAGNMLVLGLAVLGLLIAGAIMVPVIKIGVTIAAVAVVAVTLFNIYKSFTGKATQRILPEGTISNK